MRFKGKVAVVTGGSKGFGLAIVQRLAQEGATVISIADEELTEVMSPARAAMLPTPIRSPPYPKP